MIKTIRIQETGYGDLAINILDNVDMKREIQRALENGEFTADDLTYSYQYQTEDGEWHDV